LGESRVFSRDTYMIPDTGSSFFVLNWGDTPTDLDAYIFPLRVKDPASPANQVIWHRSTSPEQPRVWEPLPLVDKWGIPSKRSYVYWDQRILQYKTASQTFVPADEPCVGRGQACITLARDDLSHGQLEDGFVKNGPEITSLTNVPAGNYRYYVNVYDDTNMTAAFTGDELTVDVVLGNNQATGSGNVVLKDTIKWPKAEGQWLYVGYLQVCVCVCLFV
jgi:hypothetical protein